MNHTLDTLSDDSLRAIASGKNANMAKLAQSILDKRRFPVKPRYAETSKRGG